MVRTVQRETGLPVGVGFGIRTPEQAAATARVADAVIVGSAVMRLVEEHPGPGVVPAAAEFFALLADAVHGARRDPHGPT
jgi:tryptophan synthase alpha chain